MSETLHSLKPREAEPQNSRVPMMGTKGLAAALLMAAAGEVNLAKAQSPQASHPKLEATFPVGPQPKPMAGMDLTRVLQLRSQLGVPEWKTRHRATETLKRGIGLTGDLAAWRVVAGQDNTLPKNECGESEQRRAHVTSYTAQNVIERNQTPENLAPFLVFEKHSIWFDAHTKEYDAKELLFKSTNAYPYYLQITYLNKATFTYGNTAATQADKYPQFIQATKLLGRDLAVEAYRSTVLLQDHKAASKAKIEELLELRDAMHRGHEKWEDHLGHPRINKTPAAPKKLKAEELPPPMSMRSIQKNISKRMLTNLAGLDL